jgi:uncharacterized cofD-like protein
MFSGGSACRSINLALCAQSVDLTRIVPAWDSGGSSKIIRESFDIISVGDTRQALMTMAHGEGRAGDVVRICNTRLSGGPDVRIAKEEFLLFAAGLHPLLKRLATGIRGAILNYLSIFDANRPEDFDFTNGSVGNFILTGAYIAHNKDINTAIFVFRKICGIEGNVWPSTTDNAIELNATLVNGKRVLQQHLITALTGEDSISGISSIALSIGNAPGIPQANQAILEAIGEADLIVYGPGSFYSSILPHLLVQGVVRSVAENQKAKRVVIGNIVECSETRKKTLSELLDVFARSWRQKGAKTVRPFDFVLANRELFPSKKINGATSYLSNGDIRQVCAKLGCEVLLGDYEDPWERGQHDGTAIAHALIALPSDN